MSTTLEFIRPFLLIVLLTVASKLNLTLFFIPVRKEKKNSLLITEAVLSRLTMNFNKNSFIVTTIVMQANSAVKEDSSQKYSVRPSLLYLHQHQPIVKSIISIL